MKKSLEKSNPSSNLIRYISFSLAMSEYRIRGTKPILNAKGKQQLDTLKDSILLPLKLIALLSVTQMGSIGLSEQRMDKTRLPSHALLVVI